MRSFRSKGLTAIAVLIGAIVLGLVGAWPAGALIEPQTTITSAPSSPTNSTVASFSFEANVLGATFECQLDGGGWSGCNSPQAYTNLQPGEHTFEVRATDEVPPATTDPSPATHTWTIDTSAPDATIINRPANPTQSPNANFSFSSSDPSASFECQLDGGGFSPCSGPHIYHGLSATTHTFQVRAKDSVGNTGAADSYTWTIDTTAPTATITNNPPNPSVSTSASFSFTSSEGGSSFECQLDGGGFSACTSPKTYSGLSANTHTFQVRATDGAGNTGPADSYTWTVDNAAPTATITSGPPNPTASTSASFSFSADDAGATFECQLDGGGFSACTDPAVYLSLSAGSHTFQVRAKDSVGNTGAADTHTWTIDTTAPTATITNTPPNPSGSTGASFSFTSNDAGASFECQLDGGGFSACTSPKSYGGLSATSHTFQVRARDSVGNTGTADSFTWTIDTSAPDVTITSAPPNPTGSTSASFSFNSSDPSATFECQLDGGAFAACTSPRTYSSLTATTHTFNVRAKDAAGNVSGSASHTWTIDNAGPTATITSSPPNPSGSTSAAFSFTANEAGASFECQLDGGGFSACTDPAVYLNLSAGSHTFQVRAKDSVGNTGAADAHTWTIDTTAPTATITNTPPNPSGSTGASFSFTSNDAGASFECQIDGGGFSACTSPTSYSGLSATSHTFQVRARDSVGNTGVADSYTWTIDTAAPDVTITSAPANPTNSTSASFSFSSSDPTASFQCQLDAGGFAGCTSPRSYSSLGTGTHTFQVRALDTSGNVSSPVSRTWTIDNAPPDATITVGPSGTTNLTAAHFEFSSTDTGASFECERESGGFQACTSPQDYTVGGGSHTFRVRAKDAAGNTGPAAVRTWTVDSTPPDTTITQAPPLITASSSASFSFTSTESGSGFHCHLDGANWEPCTSPRQYQGLGSGTHTFYVRAVDPATNVDPSEATYSWTVDTTEPETTITSGPAGPINTSTATFGFASNAASATFECSLDPTGTPANSWQACSSPRTYSSIPDGSQTLSVRSTNILGTTDSTPAIRTFSVDTTAPDTSVTSAPQSPTNSTTVSFGFTSPDPGATFICSMDSTNLADYAPCASPATYTLAEGPHTFRVRAVDSVGNVDGTPASSAVTVDTTPPDTTITSTPYGTTSNAAPTFTFNGTGGATSFECRVDAEAFAPCTSPHQIAPQTDNPHTFYVRAKDAAGNVDPSPDIEPFTVVTVAPDTLIDSGPTGPTTDNTPTFTFVAPPDKPASSFQCELTGPNQTAGFTTCSSPKTYPALSTDGVYTFSVRAVGAGGTDQTPATAVFTLDRAAPQTSIASGPASNSSINTNTVIFGFSSNEANSTFECQLERVDPPTTPPPFSTCVSPLTLGPLADGTYTFRVRATDQAGNRDLTEASRLTWKIDTVAPTLAISGPALTKNRTETFTFSSQDGGTSFECQLDAAPAFTACSSPYTVPATPALTDGPHVLRVRVRDAAGNLSAPATHSFTLDATLPIARIDSGPPPVTNATSATFTFSVTNETAGATFECKLDAADYAPCSSPQSYPTVADGSHTFRIRATDAAGNLGTPVSHTWSVNTGLPQTTIDSSPPAATNSTAARFTFSSNEPGTRFECKFDAAPTYSPCNSPQDYTKLTDGIHVFAVKAINSAGSEDPDPAVHRWTIDTNAPETTIGSGPPATTTSGFASFSFSSEADAAFECRLDGGAWAGCSSPKIYGELVLGQHTFQVRAVDQAGNRDGSPATRNWNVVAPAAPVAPATAASGPELISPFPVIRIAGTITKRGVRLRLFLVNAPAGAKVTVRCKGRGCPFGKKSRAAWNQDSSEPQARAAKVLRMRTVENHFYPAGVRLEVFVTKTDKIGKYTRFKIRRAKAPARTDRCLMPGSSKPVRCST